MNRRRVASMLAVLLSCSCALLAPEPTATPPPSPTQSATPTPPPTATASPTPTSSLTPTATATDQPTFTPTPQATSTPSVSPTPENLTATASGSVNCRYGPSQAYLYAWGLSEGDTAEVKGKDANGTWLWVQPYDTSWNCWVSLSAVMLDGDPATVRVVYPQLLTNSSVGPPSGVSAVRNGDNVKISWSAAPPAEGLGYLIEARTCQGQYVWDVYFSTTNTSYTVSDPESCASDSYGQLRVFNKLGYSTAVKIPWP